MYGGWRPVAEATKRIEMAWLRKKGYLVKDSQGGVAYGNPSWNYNGEPSGNVSIEVSTKPDNMYIRISYTQTDSYSDEKQNFDYKFALTTTPCHLGGKRFWFICGLSKNGRYCGRRVSILYKSGDYFGCRHCHNIAYESQNLSHLYRMFGRPMSDDKLEKMYANLRQTHYKGQQTKAYLRYLKAVDSSDNTWLALVSKLKL